MTLRIIRYGLWAAIAGFTVVVALLLLRPAPPPEQAAGGRIGGPFQLATMTGDTLDSRSLAGKPHGLFFGFTHCPDVCPTTMFEVSEVLRALDNGPAAAAARDFRVYFITVDPERDTPALLKQYLSAFDPRIIGLVPTAEQLPGLARQFAASYRRVPTTDGYTMDHTSAVYLFDANGRFTSTLDMQESTANQQAKLARLLAR